MLNNNSTTLEKKREDSVTYQVGALQPLATAAGLKWISLFTQILLTLSLPAFAFLKYLSSFRDFV